jgi:hypothetical protein
MPDDDPLGNSRGFVAEAAELADDPAWIDTGLAVQRKRRKRRKKRRRQEKGRQHAEERAELRDRIRLAELEVEHARLMAGIEFIRWRLGLLVFGIFIGFGIIVHYVVRAQYETDIHEERDVVVRLSLDFVSLCDASGLLGNDCHWDNVHRLGTRLSNSC